ncbi:Radial spoke head protein 9 [Rhizophlyctis rosea]|uniref:Radial spoke head protein 9 homolog n=1 Tax=Rhizophlyctis rosea TaxID=64517 RepID=A0AAD5X0S4_9FUNG|nr:Radial spoke head protein 9 [Rhizophlyctis rosea]
MSFLNLDDVSYFTLAGFTLNVEERAAIAASLQLKKDQEKLETIALWGKILGIQRDYFVAHSPGDDVFARKYYYSLDLVNWLQLPDVSPEEMTRIEAIHGRFFGDPAYEYPVTSEGEQEGEEGQAPPTPINEEKRLSGTIALMNYEVQIVPRGAFYRDAMHKLRPNINFQGIQKAELGQLTNYFHYRDGFDINKRSLLERANNFDESLDIFEPISRDEPKGVWSAQVERGGSVAILRSLLWPGYVFFHAPAPPKWGAMYYGTGQKNINIGFML